MFGVPVHTKRGDVISKHRVRYRKTYSLQERVFGPSSEHLRKLPRWTILSLRPTTQGDAYLDYGCRSCRRSYPGLIHGEMNPEFRAEEKSSHQLWGNEYGMHRQQ